MKKIAVLALVLMLQVGCKQQGEKSNDLLNTNTEAQPGTTIELAQKLNDQEDMKIEIVSLAKKKDSLQNLLNNTKESMSRINDGKIDKGIEGVNARLNELKGQKENFEEQVALQKKEIDLATKKIDLLKQEKVVYDEQRKALFDKGAAPKEFVEVDALLNGINAKLTDQSKKVKSLNRNVADVEEQVLSISEQRGFLSTRIRENYNAQEIFTEFANEEESKISEQIKNIDTKMSKLNGDVNAINSTVAGLNTEIDKQKEVQDQLSTEQESEAKTNERLMIAGIATAVILLLFAVFYFIGKKKKQ